MAQPVTTRPPKQRRSRVTGDRILDATERLLATVGVAGLDLRAVCAEAGLTTGAVYSRFSGKEGLLDALFERF
ncbi:MAG: TetR/AcrR family transcriptional regulator, partial [Actinomycetes bacterium]